VEQIAENMKIGAIGGAEYRNFGILLHRWHQFSCFWYSAPLMTPVFMFSVFCSTDGTSFHVLKLVPSVEQNTENIKTGVISGEEYRKHENWCHQWSRIPKT
jgi:hypothetical protein